MRATTRFSRRPRNAQQNLGELERTVRRRTQEGRSRRFADSQLDHCTRSRATSIEKMKSSSDLQTEAPLKRAIMPNGGFRMVLTALKTYGYEPDPHVVETFTKYRKTHNEGVFDAYTADMRALPQFAHSHRTSRRLRPRADHRRLSPRSPLRRGAADQTQRGRENEVSTRRCRPRRSFATARNLSEQIRALKELAADGGELRFRHFRAGSHRREAVQWLYFAYLAAVKEQNGAAMSLGRASTFLDIYFERDLAAGTLTEEQAQEIIDDFVIKLRIVRFLRTPEYDELFAGDPTWVTESIGGMGDDGRPLVTKTSFRFLQTLYNLGPAPEPNLTIWYSPQPARRVSRVSPPRWRSTPVRSNSKATRSCAALGVTTAPSPVAFRRCWSASRCSFSAPGRTGQVPALRDQRRPRRGHRQAGRPRSSAPSRATSWISMTCVERFERMMDWLAGVYVNAMNIIHYMHDKYAYERIEMALHDYAPVRTMAFGIAGLSVVADSFSAMRHAKVQVIRDDTGLIVDYKIEGAFPAIRQQRQSRRPSGVVARLHLHEQAAEVSDLSQRASTRNRC